MRELYPAGLVTANVDAKNQELLAERIGALELMRTGENSIVFVTAEAFVQKLPTPDSIFKDNMSFLDLIYTRVGIDPIEGLRVIDAKDEQALADAGKYPLIVTQVYSKLVASELKISLMEVLPDETEIFFLRNLGLEDEDFLRIPLFELDRQEHIDHLTTVYIPAVTQAGIMDIKPLEEVVRTLRAPGGCPWDREQTHSSIRQGMLEEAYELLEAIDDKDVEGMREELGDVLLQVVFHEICI